MKQSKKQKNNKENMAVIGIIGIAALVFGAMKYPYIVIPIVLIISTIVILLWLKKRKQGTNTDTIKITPMKPLTKEDKLDADTRKIIRLRAENDELKKLLSGKSESQRSSLKTISDDDLIRELTERGKIDHGIN